MPVNRPNHLLVFNESSGTAVTQHGTLGSGYTIQQGSSPSNYEWFVGAGPYVNNGYLQGKTNTGANMPWLSSAAATPGAALANINLMVAFRLTSLASSPTLFVSENGGDGDARVQANSPGAGGDFDLVCRFSNDGGATVANTFAGLLFNTNYIVSMSIDVATPTAVQAIFKLDSASTVSPATVNWNSFGLRNSWPYLWRRNDFSNEFAPLGRTYAFAYGRGQAAWSSADLGDINADPAIGITGWPIDTVPDAFAFTDQTSVARNTIATSNTLTVSGINVATSVTVVGGEWQKNGGAWGTSPGTVVNNDTFAVRHPASLTELTAVNTTLTIGGVSDTFTSTTAAFVRILLAKQLNNDGALPTFTLTGANQPVAGRKLYVGIGAWNGVGAVGESVTDSKSNSYARSDSTTAVSNTRVHLYGCDYSGTGDVTITVGRGAGNWIGVYSYLFCLEIDGLEASAVDTSASGQATGSTSGTDASVTGASATLQARNVLIAMMAVNTSDPTANVTNPVGWTEILTENDGSVNECGGAAYKTISAIETPTAAWTYDDTAGQWQAAMIVLRQLASGGGGEGGARRAMMMGVG